jgi:hypothetical protein
VGYNETIINTAGANHEKPSRRYCDILAWRCRHHRIVAYTLRSKQNESKVFDSIANKQFKHGGNWMVHPSRGADENKGGGNCIRFQARSTRQRFKSRPSYQRL